MRAPLPFEESERLAALRSYEVMDTEPELEFDDIVVLASRICEVPISAISLVGEEKQFFKAIHGLPARETSRDLSFCAHAILDPAVMTVIPDAESDARTSDNPLVTGDPHIRFYAGMPLVDGDGHALGTLCVIDSRKRTLNPEQQEALTALSRLVVGQLELRRTNRRLRESKHHIEIARDQALHASSSRQRFLATMSHEVRTPLNGLIGVAGLLRQTPLSAEQTQYLDLVMACAESLASHCGSMLAAAQTDLGEDDPVESDRFDHLLEGLVALHRPPLVAAGGDLTLTTSLVKISPYVTDVATMRGTLGVVIGELLPVGERGVIGITAETLGVGPDRAEIRLDLVCHGEGPAAPKLSVAAQHACAALAGRYGGAFGYFAEPHGGRRVWLRLRLPLVSEIRDPDEPMVPTRLDGCHVLVVEDQPVNAMVIIAMLEGLGARCHHSENGREALEILARERFDLVFMDLLMPVLDGLETAREIRRSEGVHRNVPIVAVTASALDVDRLAAHAAGMNDFIAKPVRPGDLHAVLHRIQLPVASQ